MSEKKRKMLLVVFGTVVASFVLFTFLFTTYELIFNHTEALEVYNCGLNASCTNPGDDCSLQGGITCQCKGKYYPGPYVLYLCWPANIRE